MKRSSFHAGARRLGLALCVGTAALLGGCATYFSADVTAYHQPGEALQGLSFHVEPVGEQQDSLQFQAYAALLRKELVQRGMREAAGSGSDVKVRFSYWSDGGRAVRYSQPQYGYLYQGSHLVRRERLDANGQRVTVWESVPVYGYELLGYSDYLRTVHRHQVKLTMARTRPQPGVTSRIYEGTATAASEDGSLNNAVPLMIRALFQDFPGPNGSTRQVRVPRQDESAGPGVKEAAEGPGQALRKSAAGAS